MKRKLFLAAAVLLGASLVSSPASSANVRFCDTSCPTSDGFCNCPTWTDRPKALTLCSSWRGTGCWYV
ncbi:MAG TPA: hypothetical protein VIW92_02020 [Thermoanaerobaculia bacterium]